jgi:hypothetical protein
MTQKDEAVHESTREKLQEVTESAIYKLAWPTVMSAALFFLGWTVNRLSDHFDRIDSHLAASDTSTTVLRRDVDELKAQAPAQAAQIKAIQEEADHTSWALGELQRDRSRR